MLLLIISSFQIYKEDSFGVETVVDCTMKHITVFYFFLLVCKFI